MARYIMMAFTNPIPGKEDAYNEWYNSCHVPDLLTVPGLVAAQRYKAADVQPPDGFPGYQPMPYGYLNLVELETDNLLDLKATLWDPATIARIRKSDAVDRDKVVCRIFAPFGPRVLKK